MPQVVLVKLPNTSNFCSPPLGLGYLLKALGKVEGLKPVFIDAHRDRLDDGALIERIRCLAPSPLLIGFNVFSLDYTNFRRIAPLVRQAFPHCAIAAGGPHPTGLPELTFRENPALDYIVTAEGETALPALAALMRDDATSPEALGAIANLAWRQGDEVRVNPVTFIDIAEYGAPAWDLLEPDKYPPVQQGTFHKSTRVAPILTSRGCPFPCTFCAGHTLTGRRIRLREVDDVLDEIEMLQRDYGIGEIIIEDENFTFHKDRVLEFAEKVNRRGIRCHFSFPNGVRLDRLDEEIVDALKEMGTYMVTLGIESGSPKTLAAMKKNWDLDMVRERIAMLHRKGIKQLGCFILGFPGETMDDIRQTVDFAIASDLDTAYFGNFLPLPGSAMFRQLAQKGEIQPESLNWNAYSTYFGRTPYHPKDVSEQQLLKAVRRATLRFYLRPRILWGLATRMTHPVFARSLLQRAWRVFFG